MIMHKADLDDSGYLEYPEFIAMVRFVYSSISVLDLFTIFKIT